MITPHQARQPRYAAVAAVVLSLSVAGCDAETIAGLLDDGPPEGYARITGTIKDVNGSAVSGATVMMPYGQNQYWGAETSSKGSFKFDARASDYVGVNPIAVIVYKDRYLPRTYYFTSVIAGGSLSVNPDASSATRALANNEFVPTNAYRLWHIGDDDFGGSANSQFQIAATGTSAGFPIMPWNAQTRAQYRSASISLVARGIQTTDCPGNRLGLYSSEGGSGTAYTAPGNSDAGGGFSLYQFTVDLSGLTEGTLSFAAIAGACGSTGFDDWEFAQVLVTLNP